ncbi:hypothetical protein DL93DRAFT_2084098 [Clavulina sp. PMI_390]|nr:hypothetical protein DL93DRAFT_2084098 [Clavulina sp. PMI_390]
MHEPAREAANEGELYDNFPYTNFLDSVVMLPGGRWIAGTSGGGPEWFLSVYDLQAVAPDGLYQPALKIPVDIRLGKALHDLEISCYEYQHIDTSFNIVLNGRSAERGLMPHQAIGWVSLVRIFVHPQTQELSYQMLDAPPEVRGRQWIFGLAGDFMTFEGLFATQAGDALVWNWRSNTIASRSSSRTRDGVLWFSGPEFIVTSSGSVIQMETSHNGMEITLAFIKWSPGKSLHDAGTTYDPQSLVVQIPAQGASEELGHLHIELQCYIKYQDTLFLSISFRRFSETWYLYIALDGTEHIPRILHFGGKKEASPQDLLFFISEPMLSFYNLPQWVTVASGFPPNTPRLFWAPAKPMIDDFEVRLSRPPETCILSVPVQEGDWKGWLEGSYGYCPRSGRWIIRCGPQHNNSFSSFVIVEQSD